MAARTCSVNLGLTRRVPRITLETVAMETPARFATSTIVAIRSATNPLSSADAIVMSELYRGLDPPTIVHDFLVCAYINDCIDASSAREERRMLKGISPYLSPDLL